jgi:hypothetical protein
MTFGSFLYEFTAGIITISNINITDIEKVGGDRLLWMMY